MALMDHSREVLTVRFRGREAMTRWQALYRGVW
jgi:hypothetical protein